MNSLICAVIILLMMTNVRAAERGDAWDGNQVEIYQVSPIEIEISTDGTVSFKYGQVQDTRSAGKEPKTKYFERPFSTDL